LKEQTRLYRLRSLTSDDVTIIDLEQFYLFEHDASLVRWDSFFDPLAPFDQELFQQWVALARGQNGAITRQDTMNHRTNVVLNSRRTNPQVLFDPTFVPFIAGESFIVFLFGKDPNLDFISVEYLRCAMEENRLPDGFMTRQERGLLVVDSTGLAFFAFTIGCYRGRLARTDSVSDCDFIWKLHKAGNDDPAVCLPWFALVAIAW
jgi:hypothetical protein